MSQVRVCCSKRRKSSRADIRFRWLLLLNMGNNLLLLLQNSYRNAVLIARPGNARGRKRKNDLKGRLLKLREQKEEEEVCERATTEAAEREVQLNELREQNTLSLVLEPEKGPDVTQILHTFLFISMHLNLNMSRGWVRSRQAGNEKLHVTIG